MKEPPRHHGPTNADIVCQIDELARRVSALETAVQQQGTRLSTLEERWSWLTDTLGRLLHRIDQIGERTVVMMQQGDQRGIRIDDIARKIDALACAPVRRKPIE